MRRIAFAAMTSAAIAALAGPLSSTAGATPTYLGHCSTVSAWQSAYTGLYVTADYLGSGIPQEGILRARSPEVGSWQLFQTCEFRYLGGIAYGIYSDADGRWVTDVYYGFDQAIDTCVCGAHELFEPYAGNYAVRLNSGFTTDEVFYPEPFSGYLNNRSPVPEAWQAFNFGWLFS
jgi:hypothetical protein